MDYILFHSQYSPSSKKLLEEFPSISEKSVSVDSEGMRRYMKRINIVCVPTLILILNNKIVDRIVGVDKITNWIMVTLYRASQLQPGGVVESEPDESPQQYVPQVVQQSQSEKTVRVPDSGAPDGSGHTSLDDLVLVDEDPSPMIANQPLDNERIEPKIQMGGSNTMALAEALKKERDGSLDNKKRMI